MGLFDVFKKKEEKVEVVYDDGDILAVANAKMIAPQELEDPAFAKEMMGQTIAFDLKDGTIVSPANGTLEVMFPTGHAFAIRMKDNTGLLVHIGIETVELDGLGFKLCAKQGDLVKAGQILVEVDLQKVRNAGYDCTTMMIVTEPRQPGEKINYIDFGDVTRAEKINK